MSCHSLSTAFLTDYILPHERCVQYTEPNFENSNELLYGMPVGVLTATFFDFLLTLFIFFFFFFFFLIFFYKVMEIDQKLQEFFFLFLHL